MRQVRAHASALCCLISSMKAEVWGPEQLARYPDQVILDAIHIEPVDLEGEGYRYALSSWEKLYILSEALSSYLSRNEAEEQDYGQVTGAYALIENYRGSYEKQITGEGVFDSCNMRPPILCWRQHHI